jgi:Acetyltransferase (GNAT) family
VLADLRCHYRRSGPRTVIRKLARRLRATLYAHDDVVVMTKDLDAVMPMTSEDVLRVEELTAELLPAVYEFNQRRCFTQANARAPRALERGRRGFVGFVGDDPVGYYWWVDAEIEPRHEDIERLDLGFELGPGEVYGYDFFMLEEHRGGGKAMEFLHKIETALSESGYRVVWGYVEADNRPARWLYGLRGYVPVKQVETRRILGRRV